MERWGNERSMCHSKPSSLTFGRLDHAVASGPAKSASGNSDARRKSLYTHRPACSTLSTTSRREYPPFMLVSYAVDVADMLPLIWEKSRAAERSSSSWMASQAFG